MLELAPEKTQKVKFKIKILKLKNLLQIKSLSLIKMFEKHKSSKKKKFKATGVKVKGEAGLSSVLKIMKKQILLNLTKGKNYAGVDRIMNIVDKNEKQDLKILVLDLNVIILNLLQD